MVAMGNGLYYRYLSQVHHRGGEVIGPAVVALGAGVTGRPVPAHNIYIKRLYHEIEIQKQ